MRNRSLTKEEVDAFWRRQQRKPPQDTADYDATSATSSPLSSPRAGAGDISPLASPGRQQQEEVSHHPLTLRRLDRMSSMPSPLARAAMTRADPHRYSCHSEPPSPAAASTHHQQRFPDHDTATGTSSSECWWTRSSWAFLNETPSPEQQAFGGRGHTYAACVQFHVSRVVTGNA
uniref:Uncharacterized protein n=1 Tax=Leersia perrieri TaxID=77586 RepID=A0A0D9W0X7_9ORYZ